MAGSPFTPQRVAVAALIVLSTVTHGLLLLNDGVYWDDWLIHFHLLERDWASMYGPFRDSGLPQLATFHWIVGSVSPVVAYKLLTFASLTCSGLLVFYICQKVEIFTTFESFSVSAIFLTYPAFQAGVALIITPYAVALVVFLTASILLLKLESISNTYYRTVVRILSIILFLASFTIGSLLIFYFGILFLLFLLSGALDRRPLLTSAMGWTVRHVDFIVLPFLYWGFMKYAFPSGGTYEGYNDVLFSLYRLADVASEFAEAAIFGQILETFRVLLGAWQVLLTGTLAAILAVLFVSRPRLARSFDERRWMTVSAAAVVLLVLSIMPYVAVGKAPSVHGWKTRHALLISLPVALLGVAALKFMAGRYGVTGRRVGVALVVVMVTALSAATVTNYLSWQARWAKDRSVMTNLAATREAGRYSVYIIDDRFPAGGEPGYRYYEWASMFKATWGGETRLGISLGPESDEFLRSGRLVYRAQWNLGDFDPEGERALLTIRKGRPEGSNARVALEYLWYKHIRPGRLEAYLAGVTDVRVEPLSPSRGVKKYEVLESIDI